MNIFRRDAPVFSTASDRSQVDTLLPRQAADRWSGRNRAGAVEHGRLGCLGLPAFWRLGKRRGGGSSRLGSCCCGGWFGRFAAGNGKDRLADLHRIALFYKQLGDAAGIWARNLDNRLVGFQLDDAIVGRDHAAFLDEHVHHVATMDILAKFGKLEVDVHRFACYFLPLAAGALAAGALAAPAAAAGAAAASAPSSSSLAFFFFFFTASL